MKTKEQLAKEFFGGIGDSIAVQFSTSPESCFFTGYDAALAQAAEHSDEKAANSILDRCGFEVRHNPACKQAEIDKWTLRCIEEGIQHGRLSERRHCDELRAENQKLREALESVLSYLELSTNVPTVDAVYISPSERYRRHAEFIEKRDADIKKALELTKKKE